LHQVLQLLRLPINEERKLDGRSLPLKRQIELDGVSFIYPSRRTPAISRISLKIRRGECVALIGKSGSGKSTLVDLLTGLLEPTEGCIRIDGTALTSEHKREWLQNIAHVPQAIFLADATIAQNIAFGAADTDIDFQRVWEAARKAQLDEFVATLSEGLATRVGERGIRLSGGQRQRLGIARAIYRDAAVLVLDEATSALDDDTEAAVMQTIERLREEGRTIIIIAHRLSTVQRADRLIRLDTGRVIQTGTYDEIVGATRSQKSI
jgi:ATP-binding cassette subfamily B protein